MSFTTKQVSEILGISSKALRLYETHGLINPERTEAGWRSYQQRDLTRLFKIQILRRLGFSLQKIAELQASDASLDALLAEQETLISNRLDSLSSGLTVLREARGKLASGESLSVDDLVAVSLQMGVIDQYQWTDDDQALADRHYTSDQLAQIVARKTSDGFGREIDEVWAPLLREVGALKDQSPDSPPVLEFAERWLRASLAFHDGDQALAERTEAWYAEAYASASNPQYMPFPKDVWEFARDAVNCWRERSGVMHPEAV
ncbi:MAG: MerR family transcriptional regulator [Pseudomonadota bacterium]